ATLARTLVPGPRPSLVKQATSSMPAYLLYLRGRHYLAKRTEESLRTAIELFELAIESDPAYAVAYAGLANAYILLGFDASRGPRRDAAAARGRSAVPNRVDQLGAGRRVRASLRRSGRPLPVGPGDGAGLSPGPIRVGPGAGVARRVQRSSRLVPCGPRGGVGQRSAAGGDGVGRSAGGGRGG